MPTAPTPPATQVAMNNASALEPVGELLSDPETWPTACRTPVVVEVLLDLTLQTTQLGIWSYHPTTDCFELDARAAQMLMLPKASRHGRTEVLGQVQAQDRASLQAGLELAVRDQTSLSLQFRVFDSDGSKVWLDCRGRWSRPVANQAGQLVGVLQTVTAVQTPQEPGQVETRDRLLALASFEGLCVTRQGLLVQANEHMARLLGCPLAEVLGQEMARVLSSRGARLISQRTVGSTELVSEYEFSRDSGSNIFAESRSTEQTQSGEMLRLWAFRDITEQRHSEQALRQAQARYQSLFDSNAVGVHISGVNGRLIEANDCMLRMIGRDRSQLRAGTLHRSAFSSESARAADTRAMDELRQTGVCKPFESEFVRPDASLLPVLIAQALLPDVAELTIAVVVDISQRKSAEHQLEQLNASLAQRTEEAEAASMAKSRFLSTVSHELRTPLHTMLGYLRLLLKQAEGEAHYQLGIVERSGAHLLHLIDDLLEFNQEATEREELQVDLLLLKDLIDQMENLGRLSAKTGHNQFKVNCDPDLPPSLWVDEHRLLQILQNLVSNACKYTRNGQITLTLRREATQVVSATPQTCRILFSVADNGRGIAPEDQSRIFEPFHRAAGADDQPGLGLGLAIASQWVRNMGGTLRVQSALGQGSQFSFSLELPFQTEQPLPTPPDLAAPPACQAYLATLNKTPQTLLVVDDSEENRVYLAELCSSLGYQVVEAASGAEAIALCQATPQPYLALLIDQVMPQMDGWALLQRLRQDAALPRTPAVLVSASAAARPPGVAEDLDFDLVLSKPFKVDRLMCYLCQQLAQLERNTSNCWRMARDPMQRGWPALPPQELQVLGELLRMGRLSRIAEWARRLALSDDRHAATAQLVIKLVAEVNMPALEQLLQQWTTQPAPELHSPPGLRPT